MIRIGVDTSIGPMILIGLTDVNVQRMTDAKPVRVHGSQWGAPDSAKLGNTTIIIFHATREACLEVAREFNIDEARLLDALGEG